MEDNVLTGKDLDESLALFDKDKCDNAISFYIASAQELGLNVLELYHVAKCLASATSAELSERIEDNMAPADGEEGGTR